MGWSLVSSGCWPSRSRWMLASKRESSWSTLSTKMKSWEYSRRLWVVMTNRHAPLLVLHALSWAREHCELSEACAELSKRIVSVIDRKFVSLRGILVPSSVCAMTYENISMRTMDRTYRHPLTRHPMTVFDYVPLRLAVQGRNECKLTRYLFFRSHLGAICLRMSFKQVIEYLKERDRYLNIKQFFCR